MSDDSALYHTEISLKEFRVKILTENGKPRLGHEHEIIIDEQKLRPNYKDSLEA